MLHVNVRLPQYVVDHFKAGPKYTQEMRRVLTEYVERTAAVRCVSRYLIYLSVFHALVKFFNPFFD